MTDITTIRQLIPDLGQAEHLNQIATGEPSVYYLDAPVVALSYTVEIDGAAATEGVDFTLDKDTGALVCSPHLDEGQRLFVLYQTVLVSDDQIQACLDQEDDVVALALAGALELVAAQEALVQKMIRIADLSTNGPAVARVLLERAAKIRERAEEGAFAIAEVPMDEFADREMYMRDEFGLLV